MTITAAGTETVEAGELDPTPAVHHPHRWRLHRAGILNVWHYFEQTFDFSGGRMVLRGTNGSGKSRALEMLLPFVLDADRRRMDATGGGKVNLEDLMRVGLGGATNRLGYLWLELARTLPAADDSEQPRTEYLTVGALLRYSAGTGETKAWYFLTPQRVGEQLALLGEDRMPLSRDKLTEQIGTDAITDVPESHRERVRKQVFGLDGVLGKERYEGLLALLRTLRSPDVGNRIREGRLPQILSEALPPLSDDALEHAGSRLDGLAETRAQQQRTEAALAQVRTFLSVYRRYAATVLREATERATAAARAARSATTEAARATAKHTALVEEHARAQANAEELSTHVSELAATVDGIKASSAYQQAEQLHSREQGLQAREQAASVALRAAADRRQAEVEAVARVDAAANDTCAAAAGAAQILKELRPLLSTAGVPGGALPELIEGRTAAAPAVLEPVRADLAGDPQPTARPVPLTLTVPADPAVVAQSAALIADAGHRRAQQATVRLATAKQLDKQETAVRIADDAAETADSAAELDADDAQAIADDRDRTGRTLTHSWREWTAAPATLALLGDIAWDKSAIARLLVDGDALIGDHSDNDHAHDRDGGVDDEPGAPPVPALEELDRAAASAAAPADEALVRTDATLITEQQADDQQAKQLRTEQELLSANHDPEPVGPPWLSATEPHTVPLWRAVDFTTTLDPTRRAGLEGALLAAGLLHAVVTADGQAIAATGQLLIGRDAPVAPQPLSALLAADPDAGLPAAVVHAVLERVNVGPGHPTWVDVDGTFGHGPLRGRHYLDEARHIGATARAAARAVRLAQIEAELVQLSSAAASRAERRAEMSRTRTELAAHVRTAPSSTPLGIARRSATDAAARAAKARRKAEAERARAAQLRATWSKAREEHAQLCTSQSLPTEVEGLEVARRAAEDADRAARQLAEKVRALEAAAAQHTERRDELVPHADRRRSAEADAADQYSSWMTEAAELAALRENVGADAAEVQQRLADREKEFATQTTLRNKETTRVGDLNRDEGIAGAQAAAFAETATERRTTLAEAAGRLVAQLQLPGVLAAATGNPAPTVSPLTATDEPAAVERAANAVADALDSRGGPANENVLLNAESVLERELGGSFDLTRSSEHGVRLVELSGETGRQPVAVAAAELTERVDRDAQALSAREHDVFTQFLLGGVGEELRRRLGQAEQLVVAMNDSLASIRTSHGIGVRLRWGLAEAVDSPVGRIRSLVATSKDVRPTERNDELIGLLRDRVEADRALDDAAGYATHLRRALDYRAWHRVEVIIAGPATGQERRISSRAKLSQGETRFVSYVTLFAAADAYLSGLPQPDTALRLILLDDAFAKVDERTIAELMGLLVKLDIDFAMTGHALWGTYPQVPELDVYEVRRAEGTAAVTTHVHWDGRNRHLRAAP